VKLQHQTEVAATPDDVWDLLQDTRTVVQCLPGAELVDELGDDRYRGVLRVAIGPLKMNYAGDVSVVQRDAGERQIVLDATGRDKRGSGAVQAHVQLRVSPTEQGARIDVVSDVDLTGRIASLGRGVRDVSNRMFVQFAGQLGDRVENPQAVAVPAGAAASIGAATVGGAAPAAAGSAFPAEDRPAAAPRAARPSAAPAGEIKVLPLVWGVTRERFADFLERLSRRVRPS
jgi:uncharacterized protein